MGQLEDFTRALEFEVSRVDRMEREMTALVIRATYQEIVRNWPEFTAYSNANHRISITGRDVIRREPDKRPTEAGALASKAAAVHASELQKVDRIVPSTKNRRVIIGNSVDYAANVSFQSGLGATIYIEAANFGAIQAQAQFDKLDF